jgi:hypothetical protein
VRRRELLLAAAAAALARPAAAAGQGGEPAVLRRLIAREEGAARAQRSHAAPRVYALATDEANHAAALRTHLAALGIPQPPEAAELDEHARRVLEADGASVLEAAIALEVSLVASYEQALRIIGEPSILRTAATIMAGHAQHHALLRLRAGLDPFP